MVKAVYFIAANGTCAGFIVGTVVGGLACEAAFEAPIDPYVQEALDDKYGDHSSPFAIVDYVLNIYDILQLF